MRRGPFGQSHKRVWLSAGLFGVGVALLALVVVQAGVSDTVDLVRKAAPALSLLVVLEGLRILTELMATRRLLGQLPVPSSIMLRAHLVPNAVCNVMPAGRLAAETTRAAMLSRNVGIATAAAVAIAHQSLSLMASGL